MFNEVSLTLEIGGRTLSLSTGKIARQSNGAVMLQYGNTVLLSTVNRGKSPRVGVNFFPLTVDFVEKYYAAGKFPGGFNKRDARPSTNATLISRLIDRPIRPMFPEGFTYDVHIVNTAMSYDGENTPDFLGMVGSSAALTISDLPFMGPVAGVTVGMIDGEFVLNPTTEQLKVTELNLTVAGTKDAINMVEAGSKEMDEETMLKAIMFAHDNIKKLCAFQEEFAKLVGKEKLAFEAPQVLPIVKSFIDEKATEKLKAAVLTVGKHAREEAVDTLEDELYSIFIAENYGTGEEIEVPVEVTAEFASYYHDLMKQLVREAILFHHHRVDGRKTTEIRDLDAQIGILP
ncbi:MAG: polyribonucleotide nucleotidyltransferase, partial [Cetobacterium sp.]